VRHPLVQKIIVAYEQRDRERALASKQRREERLLTNEARAAIERARSPNPEPEPGLPDSLPPLSAEPSD
jgi:hypothetical protein